MQLTRREVIAAAFARFFAKIPVPRVIRFRWPAFHTVVSAKFQNTNMELKAYELPITKILEMNSVKDQEQVDEPFMRFVEEAVEKTKRSGTTMP